MSDSVMVAGDHGRAVGCMALKEPETGTPGVRLVLSLPEADQAREIHLDPDNAARLARALLTASEHVRYAFNAHRARELGITQEPPLPLLSAEEDQRP